ncbi:winged helix DNA-binding domain-containing protein [Pholiota conissans]|uniref:Winged helix DNA-binding domain-containing protein n=1 Tax=Pholiota conissans TaxID=109636 RepID=A0A9P5Z5C1_9AGAR|nr:winged helix DNA-binding domain-containing protein [Pholiota conissans]
MGASYLAPPLPPTGFDGYGAPPPLPAVNGAPPVPQLSPPVPVPLSPISFPLDPTRYYLLGQLEYYLSPQNMVQDFFLRQQMDARGWIPIPLIASFNRVKQLTMDVHFVRDVLTLSSLVQVRGSMVRMGGWEQFVLPDAAPSSVEDQPLPHAYQNLGSYPNEHLGRQYPYEQNNQNQNLPQNQQGHQLFRDTDGPESSTPTQTEGTERRNGVVSHVNGHSAKAADASHLDEEEDEEDEEEDVVFVMGHEVGTWSPERGT